MATLTAEITWPRQATSYNPKVHFDFFMKRWCSHSSLRTARTCYRCSAQEELKMRISSKNKGKTLVEIV
jgi:hypothetical protein